MQNTDEDPGIYSINKFFIKRITEKRLSYFFFIHFNKYYIDFIFKNKEATF